MGERTIPRYTPDYPLYGITNGHGGSWTHETFTSEAAARRHMTRFWGYGKVPPAHEVIPVRVRIEDARAALAQTKEPDHD